jgi:hypothetical protein
MKTNRLTGFLPLSLALFVACKSKDNTNIVVEVWSDLPIPSELNRIRIDLPDESASNPENFTLDSGASPVHLALVPRAAKDARLTIRATGLLDDQVVVWQTAKVAFVPGKSKLLKLSLDKKCAEAGCKSDQFCTAGVCSSAPPLPVSTLPDYDPKVSPSPPDAGTRSSIDGGHDVGGNEVAEAGAGNDASIDRGVDSATPDVPVRTGGTDGSTGLDPAPLADSWEGLPKAAVGLPAPRANLAGRAGQRELAVRAEAAVAGWCPWMLGLPLTRQSEGP